MNRILRLCGMVAVSSLIAGCPGTVLPPVDPPPEDDSPNIFAPIGQPLPSATSDQLETFERGAAVALRRFTSADGLGPDFNVTFCGACHERPTAGGSAGLYRNFFLSGERTESGLFFEGDFGGVIRKNSSSDDTFFPELDPTQNVFAQRNPIPFFGVGLIAELSGEEIRSREDPDDLDGDGISGRANFDRGFVGRFGRKSQTVSIEGFIRGPLDNHLGITTDPLTEDQRLLLPVDSTLRAAMRRVPDAPGRARTNASAVNYDEFTSKPTAALQAAAPDGPLTDTDAIPDPELSSDDLFDLVSFAMLLAPPQPEPPTDQTLRGQSFFSDIGCDACHTPALDGPRGLIPAYSDFLLHDMGPDLADGLEMGIASGNEFRTQPLWGIASVGPYLHDGRAETIQDAILAHGGESETSRNAFAGLTSSEQADVVEFLSSLGGRDQFSTGLIPPNTPIADVETYGGPFRTLSSSEQARFLSGREVFDREFGFRTGIGGLTGDNGARFNGDSCRACHFEPVFGGAGPRGVNVMRHGTQNANGTFTPPATTDNTILHTQTTALAISNQPEAGINVLEPRQTPHIFGAGLIDAISFETIMGNADESDEDGDGISGRAHVIRDVAGTRVGRFGWKAQVPSIAEFVRDAMAAEIGLTLPEQDGLTFGITSDEDDVADPELQLSEAEDLAFYLGMLAGPPRQDSSTEESAVRGATVFDSVGCSECHIATLMGEIDGEAIEVPLYSDLLLHDILAEGSPGIVDGLASQTEFRTAPLWGLSQTAPYFHTGEADTIDDAIRLHAGEADAVREAYEALSDDDRSDLLAFLGSL